MAKKAKKAPPRKAVVKRKSKAKTVKPSRAKRAAPRKKVVKRKPARKRETTLEKIENAILVGAAELDDVAVGLGLLAASPPVSKKRRKGR